MNHHLQTYVPEFSLQIYEDRGLVLPFLIEPISISALLGRSVILWFAVYEWCAPEAYEVDTLVLIARGFEVNKSTVEDWE